MRRREPLRRSFPDSVARRGELPLDGEHVEPRVLARDEAIAELEEVQQPEADRPAVPFEVVRAPVRVSLDDRFIHREVVAVQRRTGITFACSRSERNSR